MILHKERNLKSLIFVGILVCIVTIFLVRVFDEKCSHNLPIDLSENSSRPRASFIRVAALGCIMKLPNDYIVSQSVDDKLEFFTLLNLDALDQSDPFANKGNISIQRYDHDIEVIHKELGDNPMIEYEEYETENISVIENTVNVKKTLIRLGFPPDRIDRDIGKDKESVITNLYYKNVENQSWIMTIKGRDAKNWRAMLEDC